MPADKGFFLFKSKLTTEAQQEVLAAARTVVSKAPLFRPSMPGSGQSFSYSMTNCGELGWVADRDGYRYQSNHPVTGHSFPTMPQVIQELAISLAKEVGNDDFRPESCLLNFYRKGQKLGLHQDNTEKNLSAPIISI